MKLGLLIEPNTLFMKQQSSSSVPRCRIRDTSRVLMSTRGDNEWGQKKKGFSFPQLNLPSLFWQMAATSV